MIPLLLTFFILTTCNSASCQPEEQPVNLTKLRLPTNIHPINYNLKITTFIPGYEWIPDDRNLTFEGTVTIDLEVSEATDRIVLHADSLDILYATVVSSSSQNITRYEITPDDQFLTVYLDAEIQQNETTSIELGFKGKLRSDKKGFYISESFTKDGGNMINAVTQFEATAARFMVPCFDEPEFKATWEVRVEHPVGSTALSNAIEVSTAILENFTVTEYKKTVKMSSYLLAIFVGDVEYRETTTDTGVRIRVYASPVDIEYVDYALNVSRVTVEGFEKLFGIAYPMEKLDFVCAHSFEAGAMENWGLIVHRAPFILGVSDAVAEVVVHELAHQWFGNLVTMKFWNQIWLNEGFATYMTSFGASFLNPNFDRDLFHVNNQLEAESEDGSYTLNSIYYETDGSIGIIHLNYPKGSSFIRMIEKIVGTENFIQAMRSYLTQNSYSNVEELDLFDALEPAYLEATGSKNAPQIKEFGRCWTHQNGFPTLHVDNNNGKVVITQKVDVSININFTNNNDCDYKWDIPIWYQELGTENIEMIWFTKENFELELNVQGPVIINANSNGYYDVFYSDAQYKEIAEEFRNNSQIYSASTKLRVLQNVKKYAQLKKTSIHNSVIIAETLVNSEVFEISKIATRVMANAKSEISSLIETSNSDLESIKAHENDFTDKDLFSGCDPSETFSTCYEKTFKTDQEPCNAMRVYTNKVTSDRLIQWLKLEKSAGNREKIIAMLACGDSQTFLNVVMDQSYNWSQFEIELINMSIRRYGIKRKTAEKTEQSKSRRFVESDSYVPFHLDNSI